MISKLAIEVWGRYTLLQNVWGSTESWVPPQVISNNEDAAYILFDTEHGPLEFRPLNTEYFDDDGSLVDVYEIVLTMRPDNAHISGYHLIHGITPENAGPRETWPEYHIGDLFTPHPDPAKAAYAWRFVGRADDILTFSTGINMHPAPMERAIDGFPSVRASLIVGGGRRQPLLLVELVEGLQPSGSGCQAEKGKGKEIAGSPDPEQALWEEIIGPKNQKLPVHARIARTHILYLPARTFVRAPKGSVLRHQTVRKLAAEIDEAYRKHGDRWQDDNKRFGSIVQTVDFKVEFSGQAEDDEGTAAEEGRTPV